MKMLGWKQFVTKRGVWVGLCLTMLAAWVALPVFAQNMEVKKKPPMYSYVANWTLPRAQWGEIDKANAGDARSYEKGISNGSLVAYGVDRNLVHQPEGTTHDNWFSSLSLEGLMAVLDDLNKTPDPPVLLASTKHSDGIYVSHYYNWTPGTYKDAYTHVSQYKLKADSPDDTLDALAKAAIVPLMDKLLAEGVIVEYEVDLEAVHTTDPSKFWLVYLTPKADGLDKVMAAIHKGVEANPLIGVSFSSTTDYTAHRDELARTTCTFK
ncbi:MAG: hypothetical protein P4M01_07455 [Acidobacteriota bacterium]|nr:hypothetical protein [Acidobacteriota bacterium]